MMEDYNNNNLYPYSTYPAANPSASTKFWSEQPPLQLSCPVWGPPSILPPLENQESVYQPPPGTWSNDPFLDLPSLQCAVTNFNEVSSSITPHHAARPAPITLPPGDTLDKLRDVKAERSGRPGRAVSVWGLPSPPQSSEMNGTSQYLEDYHATRFRPALLSPGNTLPPTRKPKYVPEKPSVQLIQAPHQKVCPVPGTTPAPRARTTSPAQRAPPAAERLSIFDTDLNDLDELFESLANTHPLKVKGVFLRRTPGQDPPLTPMSDDED